MYDLSRYTTKTLSAGDKSMELRETPGTITEFCRKLGPQSEGVDIWLPQTLPHGVEKVATVASEVELVDPEPRSEITLRATEIDL